MKAVAEALVLAELGARVVQLGRVPAAALALGEHLLSQKRGRASCPPFPYELVESSGVFRWRSRTTAMQRSTRAAPDSRR